MINGKSNASVGVDNYSLSTGATEKTVTFTVMGNRFDVKTMLLADGDTTSTEDETITITSSKGTITKTIANSGSTVFDATTDDPNEYLKGISSFTITASDNVLNNLVMDEITLDNFVSVAATQIVSEDVPTSNTGSFTKKISDYDFTFTPATNGQPYWQTDIGGFNGIYMLNCDVLTGNDCATEFTITPPTGYSFDLSAFDYISDRNSDGTVELTVTLTHADDSTSEKTYVLNGNSVKYTFTELSDAPNDVKSIKFFTNRLVYFNNFVIDDIKPLPVSEAPTYTVTYDANGSTTGSVPTDSTKYKENEEVTISDEGDLVKTGYTFDGWNTKADGTGDAYAADDKLTIGTENVTLYAQWKSTKSAVATLTALQLVDKVDTTTIAFNETFAKDTMTYTASKITKGNDVTVNYTKEDPNAIVTYKLNGVVAVAADMTLKPGKNNIEVSVTAEDGTTTKTYKMTVTMGLKGDADVDGDVDINDWQTTANFILNREIPSAQAKWNADMNDSTTINISDWIRIAKKIVVID